MTHSFPQYFNREQAEAALASIRSSIPLEVSVTITDIYRFDVEKHQDTDEYQYSFIAFSVAKHCICTADNEQLLKDMARFIELMQGFSYPPQEQDFSYDDQWNKDRQDPHKRWLMEQGEYPNDPAWSRDKSGNPIENEPTAESYMDLSVSSEKMARVFDPGYIPVDYDDIPF